MAHNGDGAAFGSLVAGSWQPASTTFALSDAQLRTSRPWTRALRCRPLAPQVTAATLAAADAATRGRSSASGSNAASASYFPAGVAAAVVSIGLQPRRKPILGARRRRRRASLVAVAARGQKNEDKGRPKGTGRDGAGAEDDDDEIEAEMWDDFMVEGASYIVDAPKDGGKTDVEDEYDEYDEEEDDDEEVAGFRVEKQESMNTFGNRTVQSKNVKKSSGETDVDKGDTDEAEDTAGFASLPSAKLPLGQELGATVVEDDDDDDDDDEFAGFAFERTDVDDDVMAASGDFPMGADMEIDYDDDEDEDEDEDEVAGFRFEAGADATQDLGTGVFDGMDDEDFDDDFGDDGDIEADELSLLYDDFEIIESKKEGETIRERQEKWLQQRAAELGKRARHDEEAAELQRRVRDLSALEEREYVVAAEGIAIRTLPDERSPRTGEILREGETFIAVEAVDGEGDDQRTYLRLPKGRGWVFDDEKIFPGFPSVKLTRMGDLEIKPKAPDPVPRPLVAIIGRPNVGKSSLVNRICDVPDMWGAVTFDESGVTRDRTYKPAQHTDDCGDTFMFEVIDTGGLIFYDDLDSVSFKDEIKLQVDVALREAVAAILVVDSQTGLLPEDKMIADYLKKTYVSKGLRVIVAVAKCDRLEMMNIHTADFWALGLGQPEPICSLHGRGIWEVCDKIVNKGCDGMFPMLVKGEDPPPSLRESAMSVAIVGKPNAGKSSLLNALVGEARSIVSDIPGTTTDAIDAYLESNEGKVYRFIDTAGIRRKKRVAPGAEWLFVNRALKAVQRCDVCLFVLDASEIRRGDKRLGYAYWRPDNQERYLARQIEQRGAACVIVLSKWDAVPEKNEGTQRKFVQTIRSNLQGIGQWAEVVTVSSVTGQRLAKIIEAVDKTLAAHKKRIPTPILNEVVRDALLWKLPPSKGFGKKQGRIYYASQVAAEPPQIVLFCNNPKLFTNNFKLYLENKIRQDLGWFGTPIQIEWRKRSERRAVSTAEEWLGRRLAPETCFR